MALVGTTLLAEALFPASTSAFNSSNLTTVSGEMIVVFIGLNELVGTTDPSADITVTNTGTALTYTQRAVEGTDNSFSRGIGAWTAPVTTGATIQLTIDCAARNVRRCMIHVESYSGHDTGTPIGVTGEDSDVTTGGGAYSFSLSGTSTAGNEVIACVLADGWTDVTPGTGWTELSDVGSSGNLGMQTQINTSAVSTASWVDVNGSATPLTGVALEIKAAAGAATKAPPFSAPRIRPILMRK
jgi:hypothetical protein